MEDIVKEIKKKFPCRDEIIKTIFELIGDPEDSFPPAIYLFGHCGTGKTVITKEILRRTSQHNYTRFVHINCVECYTPKIFFENILERLALNVTETHCDNLREFVEQLQFWTRKNTSNTVPDGFIIALDNAERLREMDANILPTLLQLQQLSGLNVSVLLISQLPFEKYYCKSGLGEVITLQFSQYTKSETLCILRANFDKVKRSIQISMSRTGDREKLDQRLRVMDGITIDFFNNYLNLFLSVFYKDCRDLPELQINAHKCFSVYLEPVLDGSIDAADVSRLWRHIAGSLREALSHVYMRMDQSVDLLSVDALPTDHSMRQLAQSLELPYYGKYLLIAAFLASHNSTKEDKRLFVKFHGKHRKRMQSINAKSKVTEKMNTSLGPKSFNIDRLLAIFYAILEEKVGLTCNLLSQISTLVHLKLLSFVSGENNIVDGSSRLQCTISLKFVLYIGKAVGFNVRQYLCDFM